MKKFIFVLALVGGLAYAAVYREAHETQSLARATPIADAPVDFPADGGKDQESLDLNGLTGWRGTVCSVDSQNIIGGSAYVWYKHPQKGYSKNPNAVISIGDAGTPCAQILDQTTSVGRGRVMLQLDIGITGNDGGNTATVNLEGYGQ